MVPESTRQVVMSKMGKRGKARKCVLLSPCQLQGAGVHSCREVWETVQNKHAEISHPAVMGAGHLFTHSLLSLVMGCSGTFTLQPLQIALV